MGFTKIKEMLDDGSDIILIDNLSCENVKNPAIITGILEILENDVFIEKLGETRSLQLFRLLKAYFNSCFGLYIGSSTFGSNSIESLLKHEETIIYYVDAADGERIATVSEVSNGVEQLVVKSTHTLSREGIEYLNLLIWTFNGRIRFYGRAGLEYTYENDALKESFYQLLLRAGTKLKGMIDWINAGDYGRALRRLKEAKKLGGYKYPPYANDEIKCDISVKQLYFLCKTHIGSRCGSKNQSETRRLLYLMDKMKYKPLPHEIAVMRKAYSEYLNGNNPRELTTDVEDLCNKVEQLKFTGVISSDAFVMKVVNTIKQSGKASNKQLSILRETIDKFKDKRVVKDAEEGNESTKFDAEEIYNISNILGSGQMGG